MRRPETRVRPRATRKPRPKSEQKQSAARSTEICHQICGNKLHDNAIVDARNKQMNRARGNWKKKTIVGININRQQIQHYSK
mmetsp:Transcript_6797/g.14776  ORF Transcript_6797/g.14776 Transcript_6797/m.14776 type:complete len:82 (+) Transcript_6797:732-977(+)